MRSRRATFVALLLLLGFLCATQTHAQSFTPKGYYREWHNAAGQVIGYQYRYCNGQLDSWGVTTGPPTINNSLHCNPINQNPDQAPCGFPVFISGYLLGCNAPND